LYEEFTPRRILFLAAYFHALDITPAMPSADQITDVRLYRCTQSMSVSYSSDTRSEMDVLVIEISTDKQTGWGEVFMPRVEPLWNWAREIAPLLMGEQASELDTLLTHWPTDRP
jgi:L-alanine-DL-glutamate epimerase-like enolase superfamily enzyme